MDPTGQLRGSGPLDPLASYAAAYSRTIRRTDAEQLKKADRNITRGFSGVPTTQDFRMGGVEVPQAPRGVRSGYPHPPGEGSGDWEGAVPLPRKLFVFYC